MVGPRHPLLSQTKGSPVEAWRSAAAEIAALRQAQAAELRATRGRVKLAQASDQRTAESVVRQSFAHRFLLAGQEVCAAKRLALLYQLRAEQNAMLVRARQQARAEAPGQVARTLVPLQSQHESERRGLQARRRAERRIRAAIPKGHHQP
jgi:hypothetical protein